MRYIKLDDVHLTYDKVSDLISVHGKDANGTEKTYRCQSVEIHGSEMCMYLQGIWLKYPVDCELDLGDMPFEFGINCDVVHFDSRNVPLKKIAIDDYHLGKLDNIDSSASRMLIDDYLIEPPFKVGEVYKTTVVIFPKGKCKEVPSKWKILAAQRIAYTWHYAVRCENGPYRGRYAVAKEEWSRTKCIVGLIDGNLFSIWKEEEE